MTHPSPHSSALLEFGLPQLLGSLSSTNERPSKYAQTPYRDDDSDFEEDDEMDAEESPTVERAPSLLERIAADGVVVKAEPDTSNARKSQWHPTTLTHSLVFSYTCNSAVPRAAAATDNSKTIVILGAASRT